MDHCVSSRSPEETIEFGRGLASCLLPGDILGFSGDLGAGKTCMIQGICRGLGVPERVYITSPTFVLLNCYKGRLSIYHFDFYRLSSLSEIIDLGYEEYFFGAGVCLIEWVERAEGLLPDDYLRLTIQSLSPSVRRITMTPYGKGYEKRIKEIAQSLQGAH